jgi:hypothetical protein
MPGYVSVPEKTLEHWSSQYINNRFHTHTALWWPARGEDIQVRWLPARPGKVVQLELKTTTVTGPRSHEVRVDLGQLEEYRQRRLGYQPFYVFPWPDWHGKLEDNAAAWGPPVTELAFSRSGAGWWFADWMVVMTTRQVAAVLDTELKKHGSTQRKKTESLVQFEVTISPNGKRWTKATWGPGKVEIDPDPVIGWTGFWTELKRCGRTGWPQLIRLPAWMLESEGPYEHDQLASLFKHSLTNPSADQPDREVRFVTLEPDGDGNYFAVRADGEVAGATADVTGGGAEDHRTVVFLDGSEVVPSHRDEELPLEF